MSTKVSNLKERPKPFLLPEFCKGCGRCIESCNKGCISMGTEINSKTGLIPVKIDLTNCIGCSLCSTACPEPYGLGMSKDGSAFLQADYELQDPAKLFGERVNTAPTPVDIPDEMLELPKVSPLVIKGNYASSIGAIIAGCRHFYGYPITPSTEGAEIMAKYLPQLDGIFYQAVSEVATVNMMYGTGGAGLPCMTFTSSPGFSLMLEGISYMIGAQVPGVFVNIMRGGPGLGNIAPEQSDIKLVCRGLGHGNTHAVVYAPSTPQEMLDLTIKAFETSFKYKSPVMIVADGYLGQMTGKVQLPSKMKKPGIPAWGVFGDKNHRGNLISSICLSEQDLEAHNIMLSKKYEEMAKNEQMADLFMCDDADIVLIGCNTPARMAKGAVQTLREKGIKAGLFRPQTLWPFPFDKLKPLINKTKRFVMVEASDGQLENELRLALNTNGFYNHPPISHVRRFGGILPGQSEIVEKVLSLREA